MHDVTGALTLVMSDAKWNLMPINLTNPIDVAAGQAAIYRARPTYAAPDAHANNATSAVVNIHRLATKTRDGRLIFVLRIHCNHSDALISTPSYRFMPTKYTYMYRNVIQIQIQHWYDRYTTYRCKY